jgi:hypothetical protein
MSSRLGKRAFTVLAFAGWAVFAAISTITLMRGSVPGTGDVFQVDWHVYWAGARDLLGGELYRVQLDAGGRTLSATEFSLPPFSAVWAMPLLGLPVLVGGYVWQAVGAAAIATSSTATLAILRVPRPWLMAGLVLGPVSLTVLYLEGLHLATNNYLVLGLIAVGSWALLSGRNTSAGVLIGLAIATKLWPATLLVFALRGRKPRVVGWALAVCLAQGLILFGWLGFDAIGAAIDTFRNAIPPTGMLIGPSGVPEFREAWHGGVGVVVAVGLLAIPLRGPAAIGTAILAGLAVVPNLWVHYGPTVVFAATLIAFDVWRAIKRRRGSASGHERSVSESPPTGRQ